MENFGLTKEEMVNFRIVKKMLKEDMVRIKSLYYSNNFPIKCEKWKNKICNECFNCKNLEQEYRDLKERYDTYLKRLFDVKIMNTEKTQIDEDEKKIKYIIETLNKYYDDEYDEEYKNHLLELGYIF